MKQTALIIAVAALAVPATAAAKTAPIRWTAPHMAQALVALQYPHPGVISGKCAGKGKAKAHAYTWFRCAMTWQTDTAGSLDSGTARVFARPLPHGRVCGSTSTIQACKQLAKGPLADDPTVCSSTDKAACAQAAAKAAIVKAHGPQANMVCTEGANVYAWACKTYGGSYTVTFKRGVSAWTAVVTP